MDNQTKIKELLKNIEQELQSIQERLKTNENEIDQKKLEKLLLLKKELKNDEKREITTVKSDKHTFGLRWNYDAQYDSNLDYTNYFDSHFGKN